MTDFCSLTGRGVKAGVEGSTVVPGNAEPRDQSSVLTGDEARVHAEKLRGQGATVMFLAVDGLGQAELVLPLA